MRYPTEAEVEEAFALLPPALRNPLNIELKDAMREAANVAATQFLDPETDLFADEFADALADELWNTHFDRYARASTVTLRWDEGMTGGSLFLNVLVVTETSVWITQTDTAVETESHLEEYGSVEMAVSAIGDRSLHQFDDCGPPNRIGLGPFTRDQIRSFLWERVSVSDADPMNWHAMADIVARKTGRELPLESLDERAALLDAYLDMAVG